MVNMTQIPKETKLKILISGEIETLKEIRNYLARGTQGHPYESGKVGYYKMFETELVESKS